MNVKTLTGVKRVVGEKPGPRGSRENAVQSEAAFKLRDAVTSQCQASTVVVELSEVHALEGGGLGMLIFLQRWPHDHGIRFKLFNPSTAVRKQLKMVSALAEFEIPTLDEMMALLGQADIQYAMVA